jgi:hypothetical protein
MGSPELNSRPKGKENINNKEEKTKRRHIHTHNETPPMICLDCGLQFPYYVRLKIISKNEL